MRQDLPTYMKRLGTLHIKYPGMLLSAGLGLLSYVLAENIPIGLNGVLLALLLGMIMGNVWKIPLSYQEGISFAGSKMLEWSILFLAFSINYTHMSQLGLSSFMLVLLSVLSMVLLTYFLAIRFKCPGASGWLIGFGTAICGSSAIAALAPNITKNKEDVAVSMAVVNLLGALGMILLPMCLTSTSFSDEQIGIFLGATLHSVGNVAGAGYAMNDEVGQVSVAIKLARVALLSPALILFNFMVFRKEGKSWRELLQLPWYLWSFIGITLLSTWVTIPPSFLDIMEIMGKVVLTIAMAAIGLRVSFAQIYQAGRKGLLFGIIIFFIQMLLIGFGLFVI